MKLTLSVKSFQVPATPGTCGLATQLAFGADLARDARHFGGKAVELVDHGIHGVLQREDLALHVDGDLAAEIATGHRSRNVGDVADLTGEVVGHRVDVVSQILPGAGHALDRGLTAQLTFGTHFARDAADLAGEGVELVDHRVERVFQFEDFALHVDGDLARKVAVGDRRGHVGDVADLAGQVRGHRVDVVGQVLPGAGDAGHLRLAAELAFGADFARHARHFGGEAVQLIDHRVDGVLHFQDFAADVGGDLLGKVAPRDGGGHLGDVADLAGRDSRP